MKTIAFLLLCTLPLSLVTAAPCVEFISSDHSQNVIVRLDAIHAIASKGGTVEVVTPTHVIRFKAVLGPEYEETAADVRPASAVVNALRRMIEKRPTSEVADGQDFKRWTDIIAEKPTEADKYRRMVQRSNALAGLMSLSGFFYGEKIEFVRLETK